MTKEILLLEDKVNRDSLKIDALRKLETTTSLSLEVILGADKCNDVLDRFMNDASIFSQYTTIIIHASIYRSETREILFNKLKESKDKNIVIFSGDSTFSLIDNKLTLSAESLYSGNLEIFLHEKNKNLLVLGFGKKWKLNILLNILEKLNFFIEQNGEESFDFDDFEDRIELLELKYMMIDENYDNFISRTTYEDEIKRDQISLIQQRIGSHIKELANE